MRPNIEQMIEETVIDQEGARLSLIVGICDNGRWHAKLRPTQHSGVPLFDRVGDKELIGIGDTLADALNELDARCAIKEPT